MTRTERTTHWRSVIDKQKESGLCGATFCREEGIPLHQFYRWRRRFDLPGRSGDAGAGFVQLLPLSGSSPSGIRIRINQRVSIEVDRGFDPATLRNAVAALAGAA